MATPNDNPDEGVTNDTIQDEMKTGTPETTRPSDDMLEATLAEQLGDDAEETDTTEAKDDKSGEDGVKSKEPSADSKSNTPDQQPKQEQKKQETGKSNGPQDLTLPDGSVVKAGPERRLYEQRELLRRQNSDLNSNIAELQSSNNNLTEQVQMLREASNSVSGLEPTELRDSIALARALKTDPSGTIKILLTEAAAAGINVQGLDTVGSDAALRQMEARFAPLLEREQNENNSRQQQEQVAQEATRFFQDFPDARTHDGLIAQMLQRQPSLSPRDAYYQLRDAFIERGLDWSKPLVEQQAASANEPNNGQQQPRAPLSNGRAMGVGAGIGEANRTTVASSDESYRNIIRGAMKDAGVIN